MTPDPRTRQALALLAVAAAGPVFGQVPVVEPHKTRRDYNTPGLVLETGARTAACDALLFADGGRSLLATGDDKVVRTWAVGPDGRLSPSPDRDTLRWPIFREARGNIYALAVSPDGNRVLVAGHGQTPMAFAAAVIDRATGEILAGTNSPPGAPFQGVIWAAAFSPSGDRVALGSEVGTVWVWTPKTGDLREVGTHPVDKAKDDWFKAVRMVAFDPADKTENTLLSVCGIGELRRWDGRKGGERLHTFQAEVANPAVVSPDRKWVGVIPEIPKGKTEYVVEVVSFPDAKTRLKFPVVHVPPALQAQGSQQIPHRVAFSHSGKYMAVALRMTNDPNGNVPFYQERAGRIVLFDLSQGVNQAPIPGPTQGLYAEQLAFHPTNDHWLAVAGGNNHDVVLWDWKAGTELGRVEQPGRCLWGVAVSEDGNQVAFQDTRHPEAPHPNARGAGPWKYFDLTTRRYLPGTPFRPTRPLEELNGWTVDTRGPDGKPSALDWAVVKNGKRYKLDWSRTEDEFPRCYAFVPGVEDKGSGREIRPDRLVIGHYWGASVYDLTPTGPVRTRVLRGHDGYVTALAVTKDGKRLITASRDMTLAGWDLEDWKLPGTANLIPKLGVDLYPQGNRLRVGKIAPGSPGWELGLDEGDEVIGIRVGAKTETGVEARLKYLVRPIRDYKTDLPATEPPGRADPNKALRYFRDDPDFAPNNEQVFYWVKPGTPNQVYAGVTTLIDRPLWRFFPHGDREWVLWRFRDYYYDCSTRGDSHIGWQRSYRFTPGEKPRKPEFFAAEQFKKEFLKPALLDRTLKSWQADLAHISFNEIEPPRVAVTEPKAEGDGYRVTVSVRARGPLGNQQPRDVLVWVNDFLLTRWSNVPAKDGAFEDTVVVPKDVLRVGRNLVTAQCYGVGGARADSIPRAIDRPIPVTPDKPTAHVLLVGVGDYSQSNPRQPQLMAANDAKLLGEEIARQAPRAKSFFDQVRVTPLLDRQVTRKSVLAALDAYQKTAKPDDLLVFYLGGHGTSQAALEKQGFTVGGVGRFMFLCGNFDVRRVADTTINFEDLQDRLARLPCHKLVLLDACHSGAAQTAGGDTDANPIRVITRHGVGSIILAACQPDQLAIESVIVDDGTGMNGVFTIALRQLLACAANEDYAAQADRNKNGRLEAAEAAQAVEDRVAALIALLNEVEKNPTEKARRQNAVAYVPRLEERVPVAVVPERR